MLQTLRYSIRIDAARSHVWDTMLAPDTYAQWVSAFSPDSRLEGTWEQGATVRFVDPNMGGTEAVLDVVDPHRCIRARHVAMVTQAGEVDTTSEAARQWIGTTETYLLSEAEGVTQLTIEMATHSAFVEMFDECWPKALEKIKALCEA
ncbi:MAG: SRPBCC domain-containing protein [Desulfosarcinaceae bacterium]|nr:SRPBCC domain-containing protein [Desulfosarcinaceae bacterium]